MAQLAAGEPVREVSPRRFSPKQSPEIARAGPDLLSAEPTSHPADTVGLVSADESDEADAGDNDPVLIPSGGGVDEDLWDGVPELPGGWDDLCARCSRPRTITA